VVQPEASPFGLQLPGRGDQTCNNPNRIALLRFGTAYAAICNAVAYNFTESEDVQTVAGNHDVSAEQILVTNGKEFDQITVGTVTLSHRSMR